MGLIQNIRETTWTFMMLYQQNLSLSCLPFPALGQKSLFFTYNKYNKYNTKKGGLRKDHVRTCIISVIKYVF